MRRSNGTGFVLSAGLIWILFVIGIVLWAGAVLVPYTIETWAAWAGHAVTIEWWKGIIIGLIGGIITRTGIIYIAVVCALITWAFELCNFTGF